MMLLPEECSTSARRRFGAIGVTCPSGKPRSRGAHRRATNVQRLGACTFIFAAVYEAEIAQKGSKERDCSVLPKRTAFDTEHASEIRSKAAEESLRLLEWPALCRQVAALCSTSLTARKLLQSGLPLGRTQEESETLLRQTGEAQEAKLTFPEIFDLFPVVAAAQEGRPLRARHLNAVASTLEAIDSLQTQLGIPTIDRDRQFEASTSSTANQGEGRRFPYLADVLKPAAGGSPSLLSAIRHCIGAESALILGRSSQALADVRSKRRENMAKLQAESERWARMMLAQKASENSQVINQRGRLCVSVRAGRQGDLPKGSVKMGASRSGATLYMEPEPLVDLNNAEARLAGQEAEAELEVLASLTQEVAQESKALLNAMTAITELDAINARAQHGAWLSAARPTFRSGGALSQGSVHLPGARHPLLMQKALAPLPEILNHDEDQFDSGFMGGVSALQLNAAQMEDAAADEEATIAAELPTPVDIVVPEGKASVILTGPNTGGKTASLKTLGLLAAMAKAGLFIPVKSGQVGSNCSLQWFDHILADIGDSQDLAQNLSTFSGHVHRLKRITAAVTPSSLVLLDELGSGTDPVEGGALAAVLLQWLIDRAALTFCTSHHAELKELPAGDERFVNAHVEFDCKSLLPTYRLLWGAAGESQALAVAEGLGFDREIVAAAHEIARTTFASKPGKHAGELKDNLASEVEDAQKAASSAHASRTAAQNRLRELENEAEQLRSKQNAIRKHKEAALNEAKQATERQVNDILKSFSDTKQSFEAATDDLASLRSEALEQRNSAKSMFGQEDSDSDTFLPQAGETVRLLTMGGKPAKVIKHDSSSKQLSVRMGKLTINVKRSDIAPAAASQKPARKDRKETKRAASGQTQAAPQRRDTLKVQIPENTADLRGMRQADAVQALERAFDDCPDDSVLFVVHGHGTGAVKTAVRSHLQRHNLVKRFYEEPNSAGGCTVVEFK